MTENTCAVLTAVFPIVFLTVTLQRRDIHMNIRRQPFVQRIGQWTMVAALFGLGFAIAGVQGHGLGVAPAVVSWIAVGVSLGGLGMVLIALIATFEIEENAAKIEPQ